MKRRQKSGVIVSSIQSRKKISSGNWSTLLVPTSLWTVLSIIMLTQLADDTNSDTDMKGLELLSDSN